MEQTRSYLDHAATSPLTPAAWAAMDRLRGLVGNPSSLHAAGRAARAALEEARERLASVVGAHPTEVIFTSGGTEADNLAVHGSWIARRVSGPGNDTGRPRVVISAIEHAALDDLAPALIRDGAEVSRPRPDPDGTVSGRTLEDVLAGEAGRRTAVASLMWVNNETGAVQPIDDLVAACRRAGAWSHTDAVQALGHVPIDFAPGGPDLMSLSAHKVGGPVGIGALLVRRELSPAPVLHGGGQERGIRSGTLAPMLAAGFAAAADEAVTELSARRLRWADLTRRLVAGLESMPGVRAHRGRHPSPSIVNAAFDDCDADDLLLLLDAAGIDASVGSACSAGVSATSHVLLAAGLPESEARSSLRFSFGPETSEADVGRLLAVLPGALERARAAHRTELAAGR